MRLRGSWLAAIGVGATLEPHDGRNVTSHGARVAFSRCPHPLAAFYSDTRAARPSPLSTVATSYLPAVSDGLR